MNGMIPPGTRMLWACYDDLNDGAMVKVVDVEGELGGRLPRSDGRHLLVGAEEPRLDLFKEWVDGDDKRHSTVLLCDVGGAQMGRFDVCVRPTRVVRRSPLGRELPSVLRG